MLRKKLSKTGAADAPALTHSWIQADFCWQRGRRRNRYHSLCPPLRASKYDTSSHLQRRLCDRDCSSHPALPRWVHRQSSGLQTDRLRHIFCIAQNPPSGVNRFVGGPTGRSVSSLNTRTIGPNSGLMRRFKRDISPNPAITPRTGEIPSALVLASPRH